MTQINALIVDDETGAINTLRGMLGEFCPQVHIVSEANSVDEALRAVAHHKPDVVFLDIEMPPFGNGFDFLRPFQPLPFGVIFTTAYPQYAVQAINTIQPWAYLVKPYRVAELVQAVQTAIEKLRERYPDLASPAGRSAGALADNAGIVIPDSRKGNVVLRVRDILYCKADGSATDIVVLRQGRSEKVPAYRSLKELEHELPAALFCRTHHGFLVNMAHIERWERTGRNGVIHLPHGARVEISVQKMEHFEEKFSAFLRRS